LLCDDLKSTKNHTITPKEEMGFFIIIILIYLVSIIIIIIISLSLSAKIVDDRPKKGTWC
jgi:hypothetical protein